MPAQLHRLHLRESDWTSIYDYASGVAERAAAREMIKKSLDESLGPLIIFGSKKRDKKRKEIEAAKYEHDKNTKKGWDVLARKCRATLAGYGVTATVMIDSATNQAYGIDFRCRAATLAPQKLVLRFDERRKQWTWPRETVPEELQALNVDAHSWAQVWDMSQSAYQNVLALEKKKRYIEQEMHKVDHGLGFRRENMLGGDIYQERVIVSRAIAANQALADEKQKIQDQQQLELRKLQECVNDFTHMWHIDVQVTRGELMYSPGLVFRFPTTQPFATGARVVVAQPIPPTATAVIATAPPKEALVAAVVIES